MKPTFVPTEDGLEIIDRIERHRYRLTMHTAVSPESVGCNQIQYPIDAAVSVTADKITLPTNELVHVRDRTGTMVAEIRPAEQTVLPEATYTLELSTPLKLYIRLESSVHIYSDAERTHIALDEATEAVIGARSYHTRPAGTITTSAKPTDVMQAVSAFGSALKTTTPEQSYPTLRGHPPALELGSKLHIPDNLERLDTGIRIEIPPTLSHVLSITTLSYYLGANVVSSSTPKLVTTDGYTHEFSDNDSFDSNVTEVLKQIFFLDCLVRTEGTSPSPLYEREVSEPIVDFDIADVYEQPLAARIETYLKVPFETIEPYIPDWRLETKLKPTAETIEFLPFVANDLAIVRVQDHVEDISPTARKKTAAIEEFTRADSTRSSQSSRGEGAQSTSDIQSRVQTIQQCWSSNDTSDITSTVPLSAFQNSIGRNPRKDPIEINVICNDPSMREELISVHSTYGDRKELPFDVTIHHDLTTDEFKRVLAQQSDFLHYIGHIDKDGFQCQDGKLDAESVKSVGARAFLLNACQSHDQGLALVEAGSIGGIVTLSEVVNSGAVDVGSMIARLLNRGFPLYAALDITRKESIVGEQYRIVGNGITAIAQSKMGAPNVCSVIRDNNGISIEMKTYTAAGTGIGGVFTPYLDTIGTYYLSPGKTERIPVTKTQLERLFSLDEIPVLIDGAIQWSKDIGVTDL